ncbi:FUSC family protein [Dermacoccaceae bacterium W4C1]
MHDLFRRLLDDLVRMGPSTNAGGVAARAGGTVLIALSTLMVADRMSWAVYAAFGAFASLYGTPRRYPGRARHQATMGLALTAVVSSGALVAVSEYRSWLAVPLSGIVAAIGTKAADRFGLRPPGALFFVFAFSTCAAVPGGGSGVAAAAVVAGGTACLAVVLGILECRLRGMQDPPAPAPPRSSAAWTCGAAVTVAGAIATAWGIPHPYWAAIAATVPFMAPTPRAQLIRGIHRVVGTVVGLGLAGLLLLLDPPTVVAVLLAAGLQACAELVVARHYGFALVAITPLALMLMRLAHPEPLGQLLGSRLAETIIGTVVGILAALAAQPSVRARVRPS